MPSRKFSAGSGYRYGFNGKENDRDAGEGVQDYGMRIYDGRLGRFLSVDPLTKSYIMLTPYQFASNRPIDGIDLDGLEYLQATESLITMDIKVAQINGQFALSGSVWLKFDNVNKATQTYILNSQENYPDIPSNRVATYESYNYEDVQKEVYKQFMFSFKEASMTDADAESLKHPEIYTEVVPKNKDEARAQQKSKNFWNATGVKSGSAKGDAIIAMVEITTTAMQLFREYSVKKTFESANSQTGAVTKVVSDIFFGLQQNIFSPADIADLHDYANYLLDGTKPLRTIYGPEKDSKGYEISKQIVDQKKVEKFNALTIKIAQKKEEIKKQMAIFSTNNNTANQAKKKAQTNSSNNTSNTNNTNTKKKG